MNSLLIVPFFIIVILRVSSAEDKAEVNIRVSGACSPSKSVLNGTIIILSCF
jgi:hypothetical protein